MKELNVAQMENINGGELTLSEGLGAACGALVIGGFIFGFAGAITALILAPSVCGTGIGVAISDG